MASGYERVDEIMNNNNYGDPDVDDTGAYIPITGINIYDFMNYAYAGTGGFRDGTFLTPHPRETFYNRRRDTSFYKNFTRPIIRAMVEPVFSEVAPRQVIGVDGNEKDDLFFNEFVKDADNSGSPLQSVTEEAVTIARKHGLVFVLLDNFAEIPEMRQQAIDERAFPYTKMFTANSVEEYENDQFGNIISITFKSTPETVKKELGEDVETVERWERWDSENYYRLEKSENGKSFDVIEKITHNLGEIPLVIVYSVKPENRSELLVDPPLYDIARLNHTIFNIDSEIRDQMRAQGFSVFCVPNDGGGDLVIGTRNVIFYPMDSSNQPEFKSPNPAILSGLLDIGESVKQDLYRIAEQSGVTGVATSESGIAKQWDFFAHESVLKKSSRMATMLEERLSYLFKLWTGEEFTYIVEYPSDFQPNNVAAEIEVIDKALLWPLPPKSEALMLSKGVRLLTPDEEPEKVQDAIEEIEQNAEDTNRMGLIAQDAEGEENDENEEE